MDLPSSYDRVAAEYARRMHDELARKPFDRLILDWLIEKVGGRELICDLGCGPGQVAAYLVERGALACGIDVSAGMIAQARALHPHIRFEQGDLRALTHVANESFGGIAAFYSLLHVPPDAMISALAELRRVLKPGGVLLAAFHLGDETRHLDAWWGEQVSLDFEFFPREAMKRWLGEAGFAVEEVIERDPYPEDVELQTRRAYVFGRRALE